MFGMSSAAVAARAWSTPGAQTRMTHDTSGLLRTNAQRGGMPMPSVHVHVTSWWTPWSLSPRASSGLSSTAAEAPSP